MNEGGVGLMVVGAVVTATRTVPPQELTDAAHKAARLIDTDAHIQTDRPPAARTPAPSGTKAESGTQTTDHPPPPFFSTPPVARRTRLA